MRAPSPEESPAALRRNIRRWYRKATEAERTHGRWWYQRAAFEIGVLAHEFAQPHQAVANVVAVLSPMVRWERNIHEARLVLEAHDRDHDIREPLKGLTAFPRNRVKALELAYGYTPHGRVTGPKVEAFAELLGENTDTSDAVVVDSIAIMAATGIDPTPFTTSEDAKAYFGRPRTLAAIREAYRVEAKRAGIPPHAMQATVWLVWRGERDKQ